MYVNYAMHAHLCMTSEKSHPLTEHNQMSNYSNYAKKKGCDIISTPWYLKQYIHYHNRLNAINKENKRMKCCQTNQQFDMPVWQSQ